MKNSDNCVIIYKIVGEKCISKINIFQSDSCHFITKIFKNFSFTGFNVLFKFIHILGNFVHFKFLFEFKFDTLNGFKNIFFILRRVIYKFFVLEKLTATYKNSG